MKFYIHKSRASGKFADWIEDEGRYHLARLDSIGRFTAEENDTEYYAILSVDDDAACALRLFFNQILMTETDFYRTVAMTPAYRQHVNNLQDRLAQVNGDIRRRR